MKTKTIKQHENKYWHIRKFSILSFFLMLIFVGLSIVNLMFIVSEWQRLGLPTFNCLNKETSWSMIIIIYPIVFEYLFISLSAINLVVGIKQGYIKSYKEEGLINGLIVVLIPGLIIGLIAGLVGCLIYGFNGLIIGLIIGLIAGLVVGLIPGLIIGLKDEFKSKLKEQKRK